MRGHARPPFKGVENLQVPFRRLDKGLQRGVEQKSKAQRGTEGLFWQHKVLHRGERRRRSPSYSEKRGGG
jgi:hypothetical protein